MVRLPVIEETMVRTRPFYVDVFTRVFQLFERSPFPGVMIRIKQSIVFTRFRIISQESDDLTAVYAVNMPYFLRQVHRSNPAARSVSVNSFG